MKIKLSMLLSFIILVLISVAATADEPLLRSIITGEKQIEFSFTINYTDSPQIQLLPIYLANDEYTYNWDSAFEVDTFKYPDISKDRTMTSKDTHRSYTNHPDLYGFSLYVPIKIDQSSVTYAKLLCSFYNNTDSQQAACGSNQKDANSLINYLINNNLPYDDNQNFNHIIYRNSNSLSLNFDYNNGLISINGIVENLTTPGTEIICDKDNIEICLLENIK